MDKIKNTGATLDTNINVARPEEIIEACTQFGCTESELHTAIGKVGNNRKHLKIYFENLK
jgi:hypothetical protein